MSQNNYDLLIKKLDSFIRKYYLNQLIRGSFIFLSCLLIYILLISLGEYMFYFPVWIKITIISILFIAGTSALIFWIVNPLLHIQKLGKIISHQESAQIIGKHFPEVSDKLLNILQLKESSFSSQSKELIEYSIAQKSNQIVLVPFTKAIDLGKNKKYLTWLLPPLLVILFLLVASPNIFRDASERLLQPAKSFSPPPPFIFEIDNKSLDVPLFEHYELKVTVKGDKLPDKVYINTQGEQIEMNKTEKNKFSYTFQRVAKPISFRLESGNVQSDKYNITLLERPQLISFNLSIQYPAHTGKKNEILTSISDMTFPEGTKIDWKINTSYTDNIWIWFNDKGELNSFNQDSKNKNIWKFSHQFMHDSSYSIVLYNRKSNRQDTFKYQVQLLPDLHPQVQMNVVKDSVTGAQILITGTASDDYGLRNLNFHYSVLDVQKNIIAQKNIGLPVSKGNITLFEHYFDFSSLNLLPGYEVNYYVEAWDNDGIKGSKSGRSDIQVFSMFKENDLDSIMNQNALQLNQGVNSSVDQAKKLQEDMKNMQHQLLQSENMDWEKQQNMKSLLSKQQDLKSEVEAIKKRFEEQRKKSEHKNYSDDIKEKQEAINEQLDNILDKELAEQMKKLENLMKQMNKENSFQALKQMEQENKLFNMNMERIQELIKKLEMQMNMEDLANKLEQLAEKEGELIEKTEKDNNSGEALNKEQQQIRKELNDALSNDFKKIENQNEQLQQSENKLDEALDHGKESEENMKDSERELSNNEKKKASESQKKAQQNLQQMAASMRKMASGMDMEQVELDIKAVRQLLTNLIRFSFDQESLMEKVKKTSNSSPNFVLNSKEQSNLRLNARMIKDSLFTLSKRIFQIAATVNKETSDLEINLQKATESIEGRRIPAAVTHQQYAMSNANNLALILNELLENLIQSQSEMQGSSSGACSNPGGSGEGKQGKGSAGQMMKDIITGQQKLGEGMQGTQGQGNEGKQGGQSSGKGEGEYGDAEKLARLAREQAALRRQIQELSSLLNSRGLGGTTKDLQEIQNQMDKNETDLVNKKLTSELIRRQKQILTKLLDAEKAIRNQEEDNKRVGNAGKDTQRPIPAELKEYLQKRAQITDLYKTTPPVLKPYYRKMNENYLKQVSP